VLAQHKVGWFCLPRNLGRLRLAVCLCIWLVLIGLWTTPASGQIASVTDEHGKRVFINAQEPAGRRVPSKPGVPGQEPLNATSAPIGGSHIVWVPKRASKPPKEALERMVKQVADKHRVDPALVHAVIEAESGWDPSAVSRKGALGLMQLIPGTAQRFGVADAFNPQQNLDAGVRHLRSLLERYNGDLNRSLAAYNAGEHAVDRARGVPNYRETRSYVQKITDSYFRSDSRYLGDRWTAWRSIHRVTDDRGRIVFTNE